MKHSRWTLWFGLALCVLLPGACIVYQVWDSCPIRYDHFENIEDNMTAAEVEMLLGCPPGDYRPGEIIYDLVDLDFPLCHSESRWQGTQGDLIVYRDENERIVGKTWIKGEPEPLLMTWTIWFVERMRSR